MFYILLKNGNVEVGSEQSRDFDRFATLQDLEATAKKQEKKVSDLFDIDLLLQDIIANGQLAKGNKYSTFFERYAEKLKKS